MKKLMLAAAVAAGAAAFAPQPVAAADCATKYVKCLNDTYLLKGALQIMADVACFADYTGCVRRSVLGL